MILARAEVEGVKLRITSADTFTAGMVGAQVELTYKDAAWQGLKKLVTFVCGHEKRDVLQTGDLVTVPHEVLRRGRRELYMAVCGYSDDGSLCIPTLYGFLGEVKPSATPSGDPGTDPTLPVWAALLGRMGELNALVTQEKTNLVDAINELAESGIAPDLTGYATKSWVQEGFQPKGEYLTEHQDISGKLDADKLPEAISDALDVIPTVSQTAVTEEADGSVMMVNTLSDGSLETVVITADAEGNPSGLMVNGAVIPLTWNGVTA